MIKKYLLLDCNLSVMDSANTHDEIMKKAETHFTNRDWDPKEEMYLARIYKIGKLTMATTFEEFDNGVYDD